MCRIFLRQIPGLVSMVQLQFKLDPYQGTYVFSSVTRKETGSRYSGMIQTVVLTCSIAASFFMLEKCAKEEDGLEKTLKRMENVND